MHNKLLIYNWAFLRLKTPSFLRVGNFKYLIIQTCIQFFEGTVYDWSIVGYSGICLESCDLGTSNCNFTLRKVLSVQLFCLLFRRDRMLAYNLASDDNLCPSQTDIHLTSDLICLASSLCWKVVFKVHSIWRCLYKVVLAEDLCLQTRHALSLG